MATAAVLRAADGHRTTTRLPRLRITGPRIYILLVVLIRPQRGRNHLVSGVTGIGTARLVGSQTLDGGKSACGVRRTRGIVGSH